MAAVTRATRRDVEHARARGRVLRDESCARVSRRATNGTQRQSVYVCVYDVICSSSLGFISFRSRNYVAHEQVTIVTTLIPRERDTI